mgnify:CR=1 FL=1
MPVPPLNRANAAIDLRAINATLAELAARAAIEYEW